MEKEGKIESHSVGDYFSKYADLVSESLKSVDRKKISEAHRLLKEAYINGRNIFVAGNGGSAAISNHLCCDWTKGTFSKTSPSLKTFSLSANTAFLTAVGNDFGYDQTFSAQIEMLGSTGDVLVLISSSGNSPNIIKAAEMARNMKMTTLGLTGFSGGSLAKLVDVHLHVKSDNYGVVEDCHQSIMHVLAQFTRLEKDL